MITVSKLFLPKLPHRMFVRNQLMGLAYLANFSWLWSWRFLFVCFRSFLAGFFVWLRITYKSHITNMESGKLDTIRETVSHSWSFSPDGGRPKGQFNNVKLLFNLGAVWNSLRTVAVRSGSPIPPLLQCRTSLDEWGKMVSEKRSSCSCQWKLTVMLERKIYRMFLFREYILSDRISLLIHTADNLCH